MSGGNLSGVYHFYTMAVTELSNTDLRVAISIKKKNFFLIARRSNAYIDMRET